MDLRAEGFLCTSIHARAEPAEWPGRAMAMLGEGPAENQTPARALRRGPS
jgi:hypothetical protein